MTEKSSVWGNWTWLCNTRLIKCQQMAKPKKTSTNICRMHSKFVDSPTGPLGKWPQDPGRTQIQMEMTNNIIMPDVSGVSEIQDDLQTQQLTKTEACTPQRSHSSPRKQSESRDYFSDNSVYIFDEDRWLERGVKGDICVKVEKPCLHLQCCPFLSVLHRRLSSSHLASCDSNNHRQHQTSGDLNDCRPYSTHSQLSRHVNKQH